MDPTEPYDRNNGAAAPGPLSPLITDRNHRILYDNLQYMSISSKMSSVTKSNFCIFTVGMLFRRKTENHEVNERKQNVLKTSSTSVFSTISPP